MSLKQNDIYNESIYEGWTEASIQDFIAEENDRLKVKNYRSQLRRVWLGLIEQYPSVYSMDDYFEACNRADELVF